MTLTPCCSGISGKRDGIYVLDANTAVLIPNVSKRRGVSRHSNITNSQIDNICAGTHLPEPPFTPTSAQNAAFDKCVADKREERGEGRVQTFQNIAEWFATVWRGRGSQPAGNGEDEEPRPQEAGMGSAALWVGVILLLLILTVLAVKFFRKQGG